MRYARSILFPLTGKQMAKLPSTLMADQRDPEAINFKLLIFTGVSL